MKNTKIFSQLTDDESVRIGQFCDGAGKTDALALLKAMDVRRKSQLFRGKGFRFSHRGMCKTVFMNQRAVCHERTNSPAGWAYGGKRWNGLSARATAALIFINGHNNGHIGKSSVSGYTRLAHV